MPITCNMSRDDELNIIYKGTTPTFNFNVCLDTALVDLANTHVVFTSGPIVIDKSGDDITITGEVIGQGTDVTLKADAKTDTFTIATGNKWVDVNGSGKTVTLGHSLSGAYRVVIMG